MTDLDTATLRKALRAPRDPGDWVDVTQIMARGRQVRRRRRLAAVAGGLCAVAVLAGTATAVANLSAGPSAPGQPVVPAQQRPAQHQPARPVPSRHGTPVPVVRPTTDLPASRGPAATPTPANVTPTPSGSPTASPTSTAAPTVASSPASLASAIPTRSPVSTSPSAPAAMPTRAGRGASS